MSQKSSSTPSSRASTSSSNQANDVLAQLKPQLEAVLDQVKKESNKVLDRVKNTSNEDHAVTLALCFLVTIFVHWIGKGKDEGLITFTVLINTLLFSILISAIHGLNWFHQYSSSLVLFSFLDAIRMLHSAPLVLAAFPLVIEHLRARVLAIAKKAH
jgi:hypothetical protein